MAQNGMLDLRMMLDNSVHRFGSRPAFMQKVDKKYISYSYRRFRRDVFALGEALCADGGLTGRTVMLAGESCYRFAVVGMTVLCGGGQFLPADGTLPAQTLAKVAEQNGATVLFCTAAVKRELILSGTTLRCFSFEDVPTMIADGMELIAAGGRSYADVTIDPEAPAVRFLLPEKSGGYRLIVRTQRAILSETENMSHMLQIGAEDVFLNVLPLFRMDSLIRGLLFPLCRGACVAFAEGLYVVLKNLREVRPTAIVCVPHFLKALYDRLFVYACKQKGQTYTRRILAITDRIYPPHLRMLVKRHVFGEVHACVGGRLRFLICVGMPADPSVSHGLWAFGLPVVYGCGAGRALPEKRL